MSVEKIDQIHGPASGGFSSWQQIEWERLDLEELVTIQRKARTAIEMKRKLDGKLRQATTGARTLPEPLYPGKAG